MVRRKVTCLHDMQHIGKCSNKSQQLLILVGTIFIDNVRNTLVFKDKGNRLMDPHPTQQVHLRENSDIK